MPNRVGKLFAPLLRHQISPAPKRTWPFARSITQNEVVEEVQQSTDGADAMTPRASDEQVRGRARRSGIWIGSGSLVGLWEWWWRRWTWWCEVEGHMGWAWASDRQAAHLAAVSGQFAEGLEPIPCSLKSQPGPPSLTL